MTELEKVNGAVHYAAMGGWDTALQEYHSRLETELSALLEENRKMRDACEMAQYHFIRIHSETTPLGTDSGITSVAVRAEQAVKYLAAALSPSGEAPKAEMGKVIHKTAMCQRCYCSQTLPVSIQECRCECHPKDRAEEAPKCVKCGGRKSVPDGIVAGCAYSKPCPDCKVEAPKEGKE